MLENISTEELKKELYKRNAEKSKAKPRYEITGEWSGNDNGKPRIVYREYTTDKKFVEDITKLGYIRYSDGTFLNLDSRQMEYGERKKSNMLNYASTVRKCILKGSNNV